MDDYTYLCRKFKDFAEIAAHKEAYCKKMEMEIDDDEDDGASNADRAEGKYR